MVTVDATPPSASGWDLEPPPFHAGELEVQRQLGVESKMAPVGRRVIRRFMPEQHREFFALLPFLVIGASDDGGQPWATLLAGPAGFTSSPHPRTLRIRGEALPDDPLAPILQTGGDVGLLGIQFQTRRRNRLNGRLAPEADDGWSVSVAQSFGNCPKYIQQRDPVLVATSWRTDVPGHRTIHAALQASDIDLVSHADACFIASHSGGESGPASGADVSHRGGKPGFLRVVDEATIVIPDFVGNSLYNTLGNLVAEPRAGLLVVDWVTGDLLHISARAEIVWRGAEVDAYPGAQRAIRLSVTQVVRRPGVFPLRGVQAGVLSPHLESTGDWAQSLS